MNWILVVEDEPDIQELLRTYLEEAGYGVVLAADGVEGVAAFHRGCPMEETQNFDLVLLDVMLPRIDGFGVLEIIREESLVPVIMLTALDDEEYQIRGYDLKVDEYVTKPFSMQILLRKIDAILRRCGKSETEQGRNLCYKALKLDLEGYHAWMEGTEVLLTQKEFELLRELLMNQGRVRTRGQLLDTVWGMDYFGEERIVDTHIKNLRKKLKEDYIKTIRGVGYRIDKIH